GSRLHGNDKNQATIAKWCDWHLRMLVILANAGIHSLKPINVPNFLVFLGSRLHGNDNNKE
ncbi:MAG: hypothetical protein Q8K36_00165, partial [Alphaproteobacteria bacterium]|nr:hypothetical protein [Alphaproteobacteria bacterium]